MRKIRRSNRKRKKKILVIATFALICCLTIGYAAFGTSLNLKAKGNVVILEDLYVASYGSDTTGNGTISRPFATIQKSYDRAGNNASIHLLDNITQKETINFDKNKDITLDSVNNNSVIRDNSLTNTLLNITTGTTTFKNITFDGNNVEVNSALINVNGSNITLENGTIIKNTYNTGDYGGGIHLVNANLTMNGGEFFNNSVMAGGSAVFVHIGASFVMNGGKIHDNEAKDGAIWSRGKIVINSGEIYNNTSSNGGGAIFTNNILTINGGNIYNNNAKNGGAIASGYYEGEISQIVIKGGHIYNNKATSHGGGIWIHRVTSYSNTGGTIENNTPDNIYRAS